MVWITSRNARSENSLLPTKLILRIPVSAPSSISNIRSTRFCGNWIIFGSTVAANRPVLRYKSNRRFTSFCTRVRVYTIRGRNCTSFCSNSSSSRAFPSKEIRLMIGFSTTRTTKSSPCRLNVTSANKPVANSAFKDWFTRVGSNGSPSLITIYERTVSGSMRWAPSMAICETMACPALRGSGGTVRWETLGPPTRGVGVTIAGVPCANNTESGLDISRAPTRSALNTIMGLNEYKYFPQTTVYSTGNLLN